VLAAVLSPHGQYRNYLIAPHTVQTELILKWQNNPLQLYYEKAHRILNRNFEMTPVDCNITSLTLLIHLKNIP
jgi:hypothetical protein